MYETLMSLPLLKGASHNQISAFLEKTHLSFQTYEPTQTIVAMGEECSSIKVLLSGTAMASHPLLNGQLTVTETLQSGAVIGAHRLYGRDTDYNFSVSARTQCGCMEFSKSQYFALLQSSQIFLMNYLNLLSLRGQKGEQALQLQNPETLLRMLSYIIDMTTDPSSRGIAFESRDTTIDRLFARLLPLDAGVWSQLEADGVVKRATDRRLEIPSRRLLLAAAGLERE